MVFNTTKRKKWECQLKGSFAITFVSNSATAFLWGLGSKVYTFSSTSLLEEGRGSVKNSTHHMCFVSWCSGEGLQLLCSLLPMLHGKPLQHVFFWEHLFSFWILPSTGCPRLASSFQRRNHLGSSLWSQVDMPYVVSTCISWPQGIGRECVLSCESF